MVEKIIFSQGPPKKVKDEKFFHLLPLPYRVFRSSVSHHSAITTVNVHVQ